LFTSYPKDNFVRDKISSIALAALLLAGILASLGSTGGDESAGGGDEVGGEPGGSEADDVDSIEIVPGLTEDFAVKVLVTNNSSKTSNYLIEWRVKDAAGVQVGDGTALINYVEPDTTAEDTDIFAGLSSAEGTPEVVKVDRSASSIDAGELAEVELIDSVASSIGRDVNLRVTNGSSGRSDYSITVGFFDAAGLRYSTGLTSISNVDPDGGQAQDVLTDVGDHDRYSSARVVAVQRTASL
jgi:hypothetical protein